MGFKGKFPILFLVVMLLASCFVLTSTTRTAAASPKTITVPDDFSTIKEAVDNANAGDTVYVKAGTYNIAEQGAYNFIIFVCLTINTPISLIGENRENTIINVAQHYASISSIGIQVIAANVIISGFTITSNSSNGAVVSLLGNNDVLTNSTIKTDGNAVGVHNGAKVYSNTIEGSGLGYGVSAGNGSLISNNLIRNFEVGITNFSSDFNQSIVDNTIANNSVGLEGLTVPALFCGNNILNCSQYSLTLGSSENVDASNNYWGTTDETVIAASIHDNKNDPSLGTVSFTPFLASPNTSSLVPDLLPYYLTLAIVIVIAVALVAVFLKHKRYTPIG